MTQKTWFLPPSFNFLPDGELALGTLISNPSRPTLSIASLTDHPEIARTLPEQNCLIEKAHTHLRDSKRSFTAELFAKIIDLASASASASAKIGASQQNKTFFGTVDLEVRTFSKKISEEALEGITQLESVKKHLDSGWYGKRPVYIISGLLIAKQSFEVKVAAESANSVSVGATGPAGVPVRSRIGAGVSLSANNQNSRSDGHYTAPGVIYAYRLHVIRTARDGDVNTELFSHKTAFLAGEGEDEEMEEKMECAEVTAKVVHEDLELVLKFDEFALEESQEESAVVVFR